MNFKIDNNENGYACDDCGEHISLKEDIVDWIVHPKTLRKNLKQFKNDKIKETLEKEIKGLCHSYLLMAFLKKKKI